MCVCVCARALVFISLSLCLTGIGDGGNELGMGKVKDLVTAHMPNGSIIACDVAADYAITTGETESLFICTFVINVKSPGILA